MKIGYVGLGKMGKNMVLRLIEQGVQVVAWNRSPEPVAEAAAAGAEKADSPEDMIGRLQTPRVIWLMLPAGEVTEDMIQKLTPLLSAGDLIIDGANSYYKDTMRRAKLLTDKGIAYMDVGVSGGPDGARNGACVMVGGKKADFDKQEELFKAIAAPGAYKYLGEAGAGHFAKMVHNGIEYGMMEAIAEGAAILKAAEFNYNPGEVFGIYQSRSVIESRLVDWIREALAEDPKLTGITSVIAHTGEGEWTVKTARELKVPVPVIESSFEVRVNSVKDDPESPAGFRNKAVSAMRGKFGRHRVGKE